MLLLGWDRIRGELPPRQTQMHTSVKAAGPMADYLQLLACSGKRSLGHHLFSQRKWDVSSGAKCTTRGGSVGGWRHLVVES